MAPTQRSSITFSVTRARLGVGTDSRSGRSISGAASAQLLGAPHYLLGVLAQVTWSSTGVSRNDEAWRRSQLVAGRKYALRARGKQMQSIEGFVKVRYLGRAHRDQVSIRHEDGSLAGLEEWVRTRNLACAWSDRTAFLRDQERAARLARGRLAGRRPGDR